MLLGGAAALTLPLIVLLRTTACHEAAGSPTSSGDVAKLHAELASLRERVDASGRSAALAVRMAAAGPPAAEPSAGSEAAPPVPAEPARPKFTMTSEEIRLKLSDRFTSDPPDVTWAKPALALLDSHLHAGLPEGSRLVSIECHRTMCRIEAQHSNLDVYHRFVNNALLFPEGGWNGPVVTQIVNPGQEPVSSVAYLLRDGGSFASLLEE
jgi:hypothetical protein